MVGQVRRTGAGRPATALAGEQAHAPGSLHPLLRLQRTAGNAATTALVVSRKAQTKKDAQAQVDVHVEPKRCFVWYKSSAHGWTPMPGTGCAHWISHQLDISRGLTCDVGHSVRVRDVIKGMAPVAMAKARAGDIWRSTEVRSHAGIVRAVQPDGSLLVEHDSVRSKGVVKELMRSGQFFRPPP